MTQNAGADTAPAFFCQKGSYLPGTGENTGPYFFALCPPQDPPPHCLA